MSITEKKRMDGQFAEVVKPPHRIFRYNPDNYSLWENLPRPILFRVSPSGNDASPTTVPPKRRNLVIAIGTKQQIVIAYPYGNTDLEGYHDHSEDWVVRNLSRLNSWKILHGSIEQAEDNGKKIRTVYVYEAAEVDKPIINEHGNCYEQGKTNPNKFISGPDFVDQRIMQVLCARELHVVLGNSSASLYKLNK